MYLEKQRDDLIRDETDVDKRCDEIAQFLLSNLGTYLMMSGAMTVSGIFVCTIPFLFYGFLVLHGLMFVTGFGT